jgi:hypothetical protein
MSQAQAYVDGWKACFAGEDGRYTNPYNRGYERAAVPDMQYTWSHGFLDAMEAEDGEEPLPETAGYGSA